jgi:GNAT superfamily N-acetyltransferase
MLLPEDLPIAMHRRRLSGIPEFPFLAGYGIRPIHPGEGAGWAEIQRETERILPITDDTFAEQFGDDPIEVPQRCFFLVHEEGARVGTISAWYRRDPDGADYGRIHWFAIRPAFQGRGLARPALSYALTRLAAWHQRAWLTSSSSRLPALKLYLDYGFTPDWDQPRAWEAWRQVQSRLAHPALQAILDLRGPFH